MYIPSKAVIPDEVFIVCDRQSIKPDADVHVRLASVYQKKAPANVLFRVKNDFKGPFTLDRIVGTNNGYGGYVTVENLFPFKEMTIKATCWLPEWSLDEIVMSGYIKKGGAIDPSIEMCAATYGAHYTLVIKGSEAFDKIKKVSS